MATVQEVLQLSIEVDMSELAHRIFWAISTDQVKVDEDSSSLDKITYDDEAITNMIKQNILNIGKIKLFVVETTNTNLYAFYYSENVLEVNSLHQELFRETPGKITSAAHLLGNTFHFDMTKNWDILYFHRNQVVAYPYYLGHVKAKHNLFYQMTSEAN